MTIAIILCIEFQACYTVEHGRGSINVRKTTVPATYIEPWLHMTSMEHGRLGHFGGHGNNL